MHNHCQDVNYRKYFSDVQKRQKNILLKPTSLSPSEMIFYLPIEMLICDITSCERGPSHGSWTSPTNLLYMCMNWPAATFTLEYELPQALKINEINISLSLSLSHPLNYQFNYAYTHSCSEWIHMSECLCVTVCVWMVC